jgi:hypothetical protein
MVRVPGVSVIELAMVVIARSVSTRCGISITSGWIG